MQILYRYIFRRALAASFFAVTTCCVIASLINLFDILNEVVKQNVGPALLLKYLGINILPRMTDLLNVMMVLAGLFTMGELGRRLELVGMRSTGLSDGMLVMPVGVLGVILFLVVAYSQIELVPNLRRKSDEMRAQIKYGVAGGEISGPFYVRMGGISMQAEDVGPQQDLSDVRIAVLEGGKVSEIYQAKTLSRISDKWVFDTGTFRILDPSSGQVMKYENFMRMDYPSRFPSPPEFVFEAVHRKDRVQWMSFNDLIGQRSFVARQEIHKRLALSLAAAVGLMVGAWYGMKMQRFNAARAICIAILIGFSHRLILDGFQAWGAEIGESWMCHLANVVLAAALGFIPFLTAG